MKMMHLSIVSAESHQTTTKVTIPLVTLLKAKGLEKFEQLYETN